MHKRRCQHEPAERLLEGFRTFLLLLPRIPPLNRGRSMVNVGCRVM
jgi:hypothetical protein